MLNQQVRGDRKLCQGALCRYTHLSHSSRFHYEQGLQPYIDKIALTIQSEPAVLLSDVVLAPGKASYELSMPPRMTESVVTIPSTIDVEVYRIIDVRLLL